MKWVCGDSEYGVRIINCSKPITKKITDEKVIISIVANVFEVSIKAMTSGVIRRGIREITDARHIAMSFVKANTNLKTEAIGRLFDKNHSCVIYADNNVNRLLSNRHYREKYLLCDQLIREYLQQNEKFR